MASLPKADHELLDQHYAANRAPSSTVPAAGYDGPIPPALLELGAIAARFYDEAWRSPVAGYWHTSDAHAVAEWAGLKAIVAAQLADDQEPKAALLGQIKAREAELGLTPRARMAMRVSIIADIPEVDDDSIDRFGGANVIDDSQFDGVQGRD
jgi:hypothetical protein